MRRREFLTSASASALALLSPAVSGQNAVSAPSTGRLKFGAFLQAFGPNRQLEDACKDAVKLGIQGLELVKPADWPTLRKYGLTPALHIVGGFVQTGGVNAIAMPEAQGDYLKQFHAGIDVAAASPGTEIVLLAGSRVPGISDQQGADNAVAFCNQVKAHAEDKGVNLVLEINNRQGIGAAKNAIFDRTSWGVDVIKRVNSPRIKVLYDTFQAQMSEGDVVQTIRDNIQSIGHIHTGGVPGRHQPDETQELNHHFIAQAIAGLGFKGWVSHEWSPSAGSDPFTTLQKVIAIMTV